MLKMLAVFLAPIVAVLSAPSLPPSSSSPSLPYYVCSSYGNTQTVDYYGYGRDHSFHFPTQWSLVDQRGYCTDECWPCEPYHLRQQTMMIGYGGTCTISYEDQVRLGLYNVTTEEFHDAPRQLTKIRPIRLHDTVNPFELSGVFESNSPHLFISKYSLCIYPIRHYISIKPVYIPQQRKRLVSSDDEPEHHEHHENQTKQPVEDTLKPEEDTLPTQLFEAIKQDVVRLDPTITPIQAYEPTKEPINPTQSYEPTITPTRPIETTKEPARPVESTVKPTRPFEPTKEPLQPTQPIEPTKEPLTPTQPFESTKEPVRPVEPTITPTRQIEPTKEPARPVELTFKPTRPIETTKEPVEPTITPTRPIEPAKEPVRSVELTFKPTRQIESTKEPVELTFKPTRPIEPTKEPVDPTITPTRPIEPTKEPVRPVESTIKPTRPYDPTKEPLKSTITPTRPIEPTKEHLEPVRPLESTKEPARPVEPTITPTRPFQLKKEPTTSPILILPTRYATMGEVASASYSSPSLPPSSPSSPSSTSTPSTPLPSHTISSETISSQTMTIILMSLLGVLSIVIVLLVILVFCKKEKSTTNLPLDMQRYIEKHKDMLVLRFDQDRPEKVVYPKEIHSPKYIEYNDVANHIAVSWSTLYHLYTAVKASWKLVANDIGMKKYVPPLIEDTVQLLLIYKAFRISDEIMTPDKTYVLTKVVLSNDQPDLMAFVIEEKMVYFRQKFILLAHKDHLTHITVKTNLPDYHVFQNFSYKTFEAFTEHSIHDKILIASRHKKEYDKIDLSEVENGTCDLRRVATLTTQNKKALEYIKEIETIKRGLENTTFKLSY